MITKKTRAIYPVHYGGVSCAMDEIMEIAQNIISKLSKMLLGVNAKHNENTWELSEISDAISFHETKNYVCGEKEVHSSSVTESKDYRTRRNYPGKKVPTGVILSRRGR